MKKTIPMLLLGLCLLASGAEAPFLSVNCGGPDDRGFTGGRRGGNAAGTPEESERWGMQSYRFPVKPGFYRVELTFAERHFRQAGKRVFDVSINDRPVWETLDLYARYGSKTTKLAATVNADKGIIEIRFHALADQPSVRAITLTPAAPTPLSKSETEPLPERLSLDSAQFRKSDTLPYRFRTPLKNGIYRISLAFAKTEPERNYFDLLVNGTFVSYDADPGRQPELEFNAEVRGQELRIDWKRRFGTLPELLHLKARPLPGGKTHAIPPVDSIRDVSPSPNSLPEEISIACFRYFWHEAHPATGLVKDRSDADYCSIAATGFGLAAMVIGSERNYLPRKKIESRVLAILRTLNRSTRKNGMFFHYLDFDGSPSSGGYENVTSTVDTALLLAGAVTAGEYFGGEIQEEVRKLIAPVDWKFYTDPEKRVISMGWKPEVSSELSGKGELLPYFWDYFTDETILCVLLAVAAPEKQHRIPPESFYVWKRNMGHYRNSGDFVHSWSGALFTYQFAHLFLDFQTLGKDTPERHGLRDVPAVDWHENTRRAIRAAQLYSRDLGFPPGTWSQTACNGPEGYLVAGVPPRGDSAPLRPEKIIAPYAAGASLLFYPDESLNALRRYRATPGVWHNSSRRGQYGFRDSFSPGGFVDDAYVGIDQGPMLLSIENFRSNLIRKQFMASKEIQDALKRIGFQNIPAAVPAVQPRVGSSKK